MPSLARQSAGRADAAEDAITQRVRVTTPNSPQMGKIARFDHQQKILTVEPGKRLVEHDPSGPPEVVPGLVELGVAVPHLSLEPPMEHSAG